MGERVIEPRAHFNPRRRAAKKKAKSKKKKEKYEKGHSSLVLSEINFAVARSMRW